MKTPTPLEFVAPFHEVREARKGLNTAALSPAYSPPR
jgi:hypothetical protein